MDCLLYARLSPEGDASSLASFDLRRRDADAGSGLRDCMKAPGSERAAGLSTAGKTDILSELMSSSGDLTVAHARVVEQTQVLADIVEPLRLLDQIGMVTKLKEVKRLRWSRPS